MEAKINREEHCESLWKNSSSVNILQRLCDQMFELRDLNEYGCVNKSSLNSIQSSNKNIIISSFGFDPLGLMELSASDLDHVTSNCHSVRLWKLCMN